MVPIFSFGHMTTTFTCRESCRNDKVDHIYQYLYLGLQKLPQPSTGSSYVKSYIKAFILENKFPFSSPLAEIKTMVRSLWPLLIIN